MSGARNLADLLMLLELLLGIDDNGDGAITIDSDDLIGIGITSPHDSTDIQV